ENGGAGYKGGDGGDGVLIVFVPYGAAASDPDINASLTVQETGSDVASLAAAVRVTGLLSAQETGADSMTSVAAVRVSAALSAQETGADSATMISRVGVSGALVAQETGDDSATLISRVGVSAVIAAQETGSDTASISATAPLSLAISAQEQGSDTGAISGSVTVTSSLSARDNGSDSASFTSSVTLAAALAAQEGGIDLATISAVMGVSSEQETRIAALQAMMTGRDGVLILPYKDFLFQDAGGTVPVTTPGQTVLSIREQGPNNRLLSAVGVTYEEENGYPFLLKTSAGAISAGVSTQGATGEMSFFAAMRKTATIASHPTRYTRFFRYVSTDSHGVYYDRNNGRAYFKTVRTGGTDVRPEAFSGTSGDTVIPVGTDWIFGGQASTTFGDLRINEVSAGLTENTGTALANQATDTQEFFQQIPGRIYGMLFVDKLLSAAERGAMHGHFYDMMPIARPSWPIVVAHRGFADNYTQNSMDAFNTAVVGGTTWLECDVQASNDGTAWLFHDGTVDTLTTGTGNFSDLSDLTIAGLRYDFDGSNRQIARFSQLLDLLVANPGVNLQAEIKDTGNIGNAFIDTMIGMIAARGLQDRVILSSFILADLQYIRTNHGSSTPLAFVSASPTTADIDTCRTLGNCHFVGNQSGLGGVGNAVVAYAHDTQGGTVERVSVWAYTVEFESNMRTLADAGVDYAIADRALFLTVGSYALPLEPWTGAGPDIAATLAAQEIGADDFAGQVSVAISAQISTVESGEDQALVFIRPAVTATLSAQEQGNDQASFTLAAITTAALSAVESGNDQATIVGSVGVTASLASVEIGEDQATASANVIVGVTLAATETGEDSASISAEITDPGLVAVLAVQEQGQEGASVTASLAVIGSLAARETGDDQADGRIVTTPGVFMAVRETGDDTALIQVAVPVLATANAREEGGDTAAVIASAAIISLVSVREQLADGASLSAAVEVSVIAAAQEAGDDIAAVELRLPVGVAAAMQEIGDDLAVLFIYTAEGSRVLVRLNGAWVAKPLRIWRGGRWQVVNLNRWTGTEWVRVDHVA
ncbi:MAG: hypothetical protein LPK02_07700, partial [Rhodobacterales bacterium]|nr:hypothetical protein [Rhodobacterales bacterium]